MLMILSLNFQRLFIKIQTKVLTLSFMSKISSVFPNHLKTLLKRLGISALMLYITRIVFYAFNTTAFGHIGITDLFAALWFDMITVGLFFLPYYALYLLPLPIRKYKIHRIFFKILFHATNALLIALNLMDVEYFKFTSKRSTFDLFSILSAGSDLNQLVTTFIKDFWFVFIIFFILIVASEYLYRKTQKPITESNSKTFYKQNILAFLIATPILLVIGRGGFGLKPVGIIEASRYSNTSNTAFILTTPFTMVKTIDQGGLEQVDFFPNKGDTLYFNPIKISQPQHILPNGTNVVIIMLESFGNEFVGTDNGEKESYTPFLDSLITQSLSFNHSFANGKKSIEAVPAIIASMPTLMDNPYISSPYGDNKINTIPSILKEFGYESGFYHGATNGSMRFDGFAKICGFDHYIGRHEYNNDDHFDETWGILDEFFNPWTAKQLTKLKEPFFGTLFTLSSHHPYFIPEHMRDKVKNGPQLICGSINYADYSLKLFFEEAKKQPWYDNTLFVLLGDHTPGSSTELYNIRTHLYQIPIVFFHPSGNLKAEKSDKIFQQMDIMPTIFDLINVKTSYYSFGNSYFDENDGEAITYLEGIYYYFKDQYMLTFSESSARNLYNFTLNDVELTDSLSYFPEKVKSDELRIKAMIQRYNRDLINNRTIVNETKN